MKLLDLARNKENVILSNKKLNLRAEIEHGCLITKGITFAHYDDENWEVFDKNAEVRNRVKDAMNSVVEALVGCHNTDCSGIHQNIWEPEKNDTWIFVKLNGHSYKLSLLPMTHIPTHQL